MVLFFLFLGFVVGRDLSDSRAKYLSPSALLPHRGHRCSFHETAAAPAQTGVDCACSFSSISLAPCYHRPPRNYLWLICGNHISPGHDVYP